MHKPTSMAFALGAIVMRAIPPGRKPRGPTVQFPG